ncbi:SIR2 family protein [Hymenobacter sp. APR13]|uniref:SIR2 family protein n=1 Tax=Hymenobacter sp. APR13 TaxID=1356852 RepID=UPI0009DF2BD1|nr:SIR2 family protein [Hymenobacter sp. APR13]
MQNRVLADIKVLKDAISNRKLVVFAGAGISVDAGIPAWGKLIDEFKKDISVPDSEGDYLKVAQMYYNERQEKEYIDKIRSVLGVNNSVANGIHKGIFDLKPEHVITTNYDNLLEQVVSAEALPYSIIKEDKDFPYSSGTNLLIKMHGDIDNVNMVLKEDDYLEYSISHPLMESFIKSVFASKVVLFIGYSFFLILILRLLFKP